MCLYVNSLSCIQLDNSKLKIICQEFPNIKHVDIAFQEHITDLSCLSYLDSLEILQLLELDNVTDIPKLTQNLSTIYISNCGKISSLVPISNLSNLTTLGIIDNTSIVDYTPLYSLKKLSHLYLWGNKQISIEFINKFCNYGIQSIVVGYS
jgi:Leucine-rich repeat (LRR) protein